MYEPIIKLIKSLTNEWTHQKMELKPCSQNPPHSTQPQHGNILIYTSVGNSNDLLVWQGSYECKLWFAINFDMSTTLL